MKPKLLGEAPTQLMLVDPDDNTDPYNSGIRKALTKTDLLFLREGDAVVGDTTTIDDGPLS